MAGIVRRLKVIPWEELERYDLDHQVGLQTGGRDESVTGRSIS